MSTLQDLIAQKAALEQQIAEVRQSELAAAISQVRALVSEHGLTIADVFPSGKAKPAPKKTSKVAPKYRDPATGNTWSGRGLPPKWLQGKNKADFAIA
jgi:DNA-binding protein H-NS